jgi:hypothetical protein
VTRRQLTTAQAAELAGVSPTNWRGWRARGVPKGNPVPPPDGHHDLRTPWWWSTSVEQWKARRPKEQG